MDPQRYGALGMDSKIALIQALIPIGLMHIEELLQQEVVELAGKRYKRDRINQCACRTEDRQGGLLEEQQS